jgi:catechol 2,3-dioxygenase-like lactoylglutathione lyase family enzyme
MSKVPPIPRLTVITLGVSNMRASIAFYEALGFVRKIRYYGANATSLTAPHPHMGRRYDGARGLGRIQIFRIGRP